MNLEQIKNLYTEEEIKKIKENSREIYMRAGEDLSNVVINLEKLRRQGKLNCYVNFNGKKIYSLDVTMNSAYKEVLGCSRRTSLKREKKWKQQSEDLEKQWDKEAEEKLSYWISEGEKYIHPEKKDNWKNTCVIHSKSDYYGLEVEYAITVMKMLNDGIDFEVIKETIKNQGHSGRSYALMMDIVLNYSNNGPYFYRYCNKGNMNKYDIKYVAKIKQLNKKLDNGEKYIDACKSLVDKQIMNISIENKLYRKSFNGVILVNNDFTFEGIVNENDEENYISGVINNGIVHYIIMGSVLPNTSTVIKNNNEFIGISAYYVGNQKIYNGEVTVSLKDADVLFYNKICLEYDIHKMKKYFSKAMKSVFKQYVNDIESSISSDLETIKQNLFDRFNNSLNMRIDSLNSNSKVLEKTNN